MKQGLKGEPGERHGGWERRVEKGWDTTVPLDSRGGARRACDIQSGASCWRTCGEDRHLSLESAHDLPIRILSLARREHLPPEPLYLTLPAPPIPRETAQAFRRTAQETVLSSFSSSSQTPPMITASPLPSHTQRTRGGAPQAICSPSHSSHPGARLSAVTVACVGVATCSTPARSRAVRRWRLVFSGSKKAEISPSTPAPHTPSSERKDSIACTA